MALHNFVHFNWLSPWAQWELHCSIKHSLDLYAPQITFLEGTPPRQDNTDLHLRSTVLPVTVFTYDKYCLANSENSFERKNLEVPHNMLTN